MPALVTRLVLSLVLLVLAACGGTTADQPDSSSVERTGSSDSATIDCDSFIRERHIDQKAAIYRWQIECLGFDTTLFAQNRLPEGIICVRGARPPANAQPSARVWGTTCFPDTPSGGGGLASEPTAVPQRDFAAQTQRCIDKVRDGASEWSLYIAGCSYSQSDTFDWYAVEEAKRQYQQDYDLKTDHCRDLVLDGASSMQLFLGGCDGSYFGAQDFDKWAVEEAKREYEDGYDNQTQYCADLASRGASSMTMWMNNCSSASPGVGTDFDEGQVREAEREFEWEQEERDNRCGELERSGASWFDLWSNDCD